MATFLGFDYGKKFIGVAVGSAHSRLAEPLATVHMGKNAPDWAHIERLIREWAPGAFVVGLPLNMDGTPNPMTRTARAFGERLKDRYNLPVHMVDERLTTLAAKQTLYAAGVAGTRHKRHLDKLAAQTILQAFLNELPDSREPER